MTTAAELRAQLGDGPAWLVRATTPPSMAVEVGNQTVELEGTVFEMRGWQGNVIWTTTSADAQPRVDLICIAVEFGEVFARALTGVPSGSPCPPAVPSGWLPVATVHIRAYMSCVFPSNIQEIRP